MDRAHHLGEPVMDILLPPSGTGPGVLVAHPWWGLNRTIRDYAAALAAQGFVVGLVDAFNGEVTTEIARAEQFLPKYMQSAGPGVGAVGFSFGGFQLLKLLGDSTLPLNRLVAYYAVYPLPDSHIPVLAHFAGKDDFETDEDMAAMAEALAAAGAPNASHRYAGTAHWFAEADRPEYDAAAARLAFERTVAFLRA
jgi:carboxymethylenebutenolidase